LFSVRLRLNLQRGAEDPRISKGTMIGNSNASTFVPAENEKLKNFVDRQFEQSCHFTILCYTGGGRDSAQYFREISTLLRFSQPGLSQNAPLPSSTDNWADS
jgi:hypothetical protein